MAALGSTDEGTKAQLNENALLMYSSLINMGYGDIESIMAANQHPKNIMLAIHWISSQNSQSQSPASAPPNTSSSSSTFQSTVTPAPSANTLDIDTWASKNKLDSSIATTLKDNGVVSVEDLLLLSTEEEMIEFAKELGFNIMRRKKFIKAVKSLQQDQASAPANPAPNQPHFPSQSQASNMFANSQDDVKSASSANLSGEVKVPYSLNRSGLDMKKRNRCILVIGATGTGKTTCLNSMMNYLWEVKYDDKFRYKLIFEDQNANQAESQTKTVTAHYLNPPKLDYSLTLVDTPGYGDTVGITQDDRITQKIKHFFDKEIQSIDAVCFVIRGPQARLEATQKYVFNKVLEVFGKDIKDNIFILFTFADSQKPPALAAIKEAKIPYKKYFKLNNAGFFDIPTADGDDTKTNSGEDDDSSDSGDVFGAGYWDMGMRAFDKFFKSLDTVQTKSLSLTRQVLTRREQLQNYIVGIQPTIDATYAILEKMRTLINEIYRNAAIVDSSKDYYITVDVPKTRQVPVTDGRNTTTCTNCVGHYTCHKKCAFVDHADKKRCCAMDRNGDCTVCPGKCNWICHKNLPYTVEFYTEKEQQTVADLKKRYYDAKNKQSASDQIIVGLTDDLVNKEAYLGEIIDNVRQCINELRNIALQPNIMVMDDYIDQLIESERREMNRGWQSRIKSLENLKERHNMLINIDDEKFDSFGKFDNYQDVNQYLDSKKHRRRVYLQQAKQVEKMKLKEEKMGYGKKKKRDKEEMIRLQQQKKRKHNEMMRLRQQREKEKTKAGGLWGLMDGLFGSK